MVLPLCKPCGGHGSVGLVSGLWKQISGGQSVIVVSTRAHPKGEVRGTLTGRLADYRRPRTICMTVSELDRSESLPE